MRFSRPGFTALALAGLCWGASLLGLETSLRILQAPASIDADSHLILGLTLAALCQGLIFMVAAVMAWPVVARLDRRREAKLLRFSVGIAPGMPLLALALVSIALARTSNGLERLLPPNDHRGSGPNVVLVVIDSLRQDALELPDHDEIAPNIVRFGESYTSYAMAQSIASWTKPSMSAMVTGRPPSWLGTHEGNLSEDALTVAELLREGGYETAAISDNYLTCPELGFGQGHELYWCKNNQALLLSLYLSRLATQRAKRRAARDLHVFYQGGEQLTDVATSWLKGRDRDRPFYLMIHYMDVHYPFYVYRENPANRSNRSTRETFLPYYDVLIASRSRPRPPFADLEIAPGQVEDFRQRYLGAVQFLDGHVGRLFDVLRELDVWDDTLVVLTADHGEELFEHRYFSHGSTLYQESVRVPLHVKWPSQREAVSISSAVSSLQILSTILEAAHLDPPEGVATPLPRQPPERERVVFSEHNRHGIVIHAAQLGRYKRLHSATDAGRTLDELYDVEADVAEEHDLWRDGRRPSPELEGAFEAFRAQTSDGASLDAPPLNDADIERLRSLGYVE